MRQLSRKPYALDFLSPCPADQPAAGRLRPAGRSQKPGTPKANRILSWSFAPSPRPHKTCCKRTWNSTATATWKVCAAKTDPPGECGRCRHSQTLGTLGYFAPTVELVLEAPPRDSEVLPTVRITVDAGVQTTVGAGRHPGDQPARGRKSRQLATPKHSAAIGPWRWGSRSPKRPGPAPRPKGCASLEARRYPTAALTTSRAEIDADTHQAHLQAHYATGPLVRFGALTIEGGERYDNAGVARAARPARGGGIPGKPPCSMCSSAWRPRACTTRYF